MVIKYEITCKTFRRKRKGHQSYGIFDSRLSLCLKHPEPSGGKSSVNGDDIKREFFPEKKGKSFDCSVKKQRQKRNRRCRAIDRQCRILTGKPQGEGSLL